MKVEAIKAFLKAQSEMGSAIKDAKNPFLKNKYATLKSVQDAVFPVFHTNGFALLQCGGADQYGQFIETLALHESGEAFSSKIYLDYKVGDMQSKGGAVTYARRYGLQSITGIPIEDDDGNMAVGHDRVQQKVSRPQSNDINERASKIMRFIPAATIEQMSKMRVDAQNLIESVRENDRDFATKIEIAWENRELELGMK